MRKREQQGKANRVPAIARREHMAALEAIGRMSGNREQQNCRQKLRQPDIPQIERPVGDLVNLPAHGHGLHLNRGDNEEPGDLEKHESGMREGGASGPGVGGCRHERLM